MSVAGGYSLEELKRLSHAIIHFEPALEALLPEDRRGNEYTKSNWIDNPNFGRRRVSRRESMALIERCTTGRELILLMNPNRNGEHDKFYGWNFLNLLASPEATVEFRRGAASVNTQDALIWIEFAISFVQTSLNFGTIENLRRVPADVGGLRWFLDSSKPSSAMHDYRCVDLFFAGSNPQASIQPKPAGQLSLAKSKKLKQKMMED